MALRNGKDYLEGLVDGRQLWLGGELVTNVAEHPAFRGTARAVAELYDLQCASELADELSWVDAASGERFGAAYIEPRTAADLQFRRRALELRARLHGGMLGRPPEFMNVMMTAFASASGHFAQGGAQFGDVARSTYERLRGADLALTHTLVHPQRDRSTVTPTASDQENAARVVKETDGGFVVRGARMLATLGPFADEIAVFPSGSRYLPDSEEAKQFAFACLIPVSSPGLRFICRGSLTPPGGRVIDHPLMSRLDEMDCVVIFDDVEVPWERTYVYRDPGLTMLAASGVSGQSQSQAAIKDMVKAEFLLGIAYQLAEATNTIQFPNVLNHIAEMVTATEMVRGAVLGSEAAAGPGPGGTLVPSTALLRAERLYYLEIFPELQKKLQILGAGGLMMTAPVGEIDGPRGGDIEEFYQAANLDARRRIELFGLASDAATSSFAGRQALYERYFSGDPFRLAAMAAQTYPSRSEVCEQVRSFLDRTREWDAEFRPGPAGARGQL